MSLLTLYHIDFRIPLSLILLTCPTILLHIWNGSVFSKYLTALAHSGVNMIVYLPDHSSWKREREWIAPEKIALCSVAPVIMNTLTLVHNTVGSLKVVTEQYWNIVPQDSRASARSHNKNIDLNLSLR